MSSVSETGRPIAVIVGTTVITPTPCVLLGFFCTTAGNLTIKDKNDAVVVPLFPAAVGVFYPLPFSMGNGLKYVSTAVGVLAVQD